MTMTSKAEIDNQISVVQAMQNSAYQRVADAMREEKVKIASDCDGDINYAIENYSNMPIVIFNATVEAMARKVETMKS